MRLSIWEGASWIKKYPIDSLQIYFASSLELQEELIRRGFYVPKSPSGTIFMPIPIIYSDFRGWLVQKGPVTIERLIPPQWLGLTPQQLNWRKTRVNGKEAYDIPKEEVYVNLGISNETVLLDLEVLKYHLERTSIRGINPERWTNWVMFYVDAEFLDELIELLKEYLPTQARSPTFVPHAAGKPILEKQQGGKEVTYYVKVIARDFSLCMGCFEQAQRYLTVKAQEHCRMYPSLPFCKDLENELKSLRLRLRYSEKVEVFAKVGVAKIAGKKPQVMVKLASVGPTINIRGVLKSEIKGKARGELICCDHASRRQYLALDLPSFHYALATTKNCLTKLPKE
jgi:hypothetical protein